MFRMPVPSRLMPLLLVLLLSIPACSGRGAPSERRDPSVLTEAEIEASGYTDAFSMVQALRPQWLRTRGATSLTQREFVQVYVDGSRMGSPETLQQLPVSTISSMRYLTGLEATQRWGLDHGAGAIVVLTKR
jgi:hypothetical protein